MRRIAAIGILLLLSAPTAGSAADLAAGEAAFNRCKICHNVAAGAGAKVGPNLHDIFGRKAGSLDHFHYSPAMEKSGVVWNDETLAEFLRNPQQFIPGNHMAFPGIKDDRQLSDLLAYLHQAAQ